MTNKTTFTGLNLTDAEFAQAQLKMKANGYTLTRDGNRIAVAPEVGL